MDEVLMMKLRRILIISIILALFVNGCVEKAENLSNLDYVDPYIGNVGILLQPTRPTVQMPNQMIRIYPVRKDYIDDQIRYFPLTISSHRSDELFGIMPFACTINDDDYNYAQTYDHELEIARPYYFYTYFIDTEIQTEYTVGAKSGYFRFNFPQDSPKLIRLQINHKGQWQSGSNNSIFGVEEFKGMKAYLYAEFNSAGKTEQRNSKLFVTFPDGSIKTVEFKYGISFIGIEQAKANLIKEIPAWNFDALKDRGKKIWEEKLNRIQVKGETEAQRRSFYTALYRCHERMININEDGQYYSAYDHKVHQSKRDFYVDDWVWDTYLALHPLRMILHPAQEADMLQSYVEMYRQSGWLPQFPLLFKDAPFMNGFHSTIMFLDAWRKGIRDYDVKKAYEGMKKNAEEATMLPWRNGPKTGLDIFYRQKGFFPALEPGEKETYKEVDSFERRQSVAVTLGACYDDWALAQMAKELEHSADFEYFIGQAKNYRNLYYPEYKLFMPKNAKGNWIMIDPKFDGGMGGRDYYDENNGYTYAWQVQHDIRGLIKLHGGKDNFIKDLDGLFRESLGRQKYKFLAKFPDATGLVGQFSMGNEPSFHIPYLYNYAGAPWKTQKRIRFLLDAWYKDNIFGIPGDEDGGGMSAFVVFSSMGFYPVTPGLPIYNIGSPVFKEIKINLENGKTFTIIAHNGSNINKYIQSAKLNGKTLDRPWFTHEDILAGSTLELEMGKYPNKKWGSSPESAPFSSVDIQ